MEQIRKIYNRVPVHPLLISLYLVLFLWTTNIDEILFFVIFTSLAYSLVFVLSIYLITCLILRNCQQAALITSLIAILALSYGHVYNFILEQEFLSAHIGYYRLLAICLFILIIGVIFIWKYRKSLQAANRILNFTFFVLIAITLGQAALHFLSNPPVNMQSVQTEKMQNDSTQIGLDRDVYYIILDSYSREDILAYFNFDNSAFIHELKELGFVIPECTQSNYSFTAQSMASSLNMNYLTELSIPLNKNWEELVIQDLSPFIKNNLIRKMFEDMGYQTVTFKTVYPYLNIDDADFYYDFEQSVEFYDKLETDNFQYLFANTTILRLLIEADFLPDDQYENNTFPGIIRLAKLLIPKDDLFSERLFKVYEQNQYNFDQLEEIPNIPGSKFVYAHLFSTHQPFVFTADGQVRWPVLENNEGYVSQVIYTNQRILEIVETILEESNVPPVIIIQSDHSYKGSERNKILNAFHLPDGGAENIPPDLTPVNTFRIIFNHYFGGNFDLLPNIAYASSKENTYDVIPKSCVGTTP